MKNTSVVRDFNNNSAATLTINRSQSLLTTNSRVPILAPSRGERARLEALLGDVWSREILPFPGMTTRSRSEHLVRTSASSVMRKLSVASITSSFNKRSASVTQKAKADDGAERTELPKRLKGKDEPTHGDGAASVAITADEDSVDRDTMRRTKRPRTAEASRHTLAKTEASEVEVKEVCGTICQLRSTEAASTKEADEAEMGEAGLLKIPILRTASPNGLRMSVSSMSEKSPRGSMEKENTCRSPHGKGRGHGRWARVGMTKSEGRGHGFRSLFR